MRKLLAAVIFSSFALVPVLPALGQDAGAGLRTPACTARQLTFDVKDAPHATSHSGLLAVVQNNGPAACSLSPKPAFKFLDAAHEHPDLTWRAPVGMHPGPVMVPLVLAPGVAFTALLQWVDSPVFEHSRCIDLISISLPADSGNLSSSMQGHLCGLAGRPLTYDLEPLHPDPKTGAHKPS